MMDTLTRDGYLGCVGDFVEVVEGDLHSEAAILYRTNNKTQKAPSIVNRTKITKIAPIVPSSNCKSNQKVLNQFNNCLTAT